jgi:hypothetical protein
MLELRQTIEVPLNEAPSPITIRDDGYIVFSLQEAKREADKQKRLLLINTISLPTSMVDPIAILIIGRPITSMLLKKESGRTPRNTISHFQKKPRICW